VSTGILNSTLLFDVTRPLSRDGQLDTQRNSAKTKQLGLIPSLDKKSKIKESKMARLEAGMQEKLGGMLPTSSHRGGVVMWSPLSNKRIGPNGGSTFRGV